MGYTWYIGKRICQSNSVGFSTLSAGIESMEFQNRKSRFTHPQWKRVRDKHKIKIREQRCQSGQSAKNSVIFSGRDSSKNDGADQQRLQISDLHFDKFPSPAAFACWKIKLKTEVCTCSQFPTEAMHWIKEMEIWLIQWMIFKFSSICKRNSNAEFRNTRCEDCFSTEQNHP